MKYLSKTQKKIEVKKDQDFTVWVNVNKIEKNITFMVIYPHEENSNLPGEAIEELDGLWTYQQLKVYKRLKWNNIFLTLDKLKICVFKDRPKDPKAKDGPIHSELIEEGFIQLSTIIGKHSINKKRQPINYESIPPTPKNYNKPLHFQIGERVISRYFNTYFQGTITEINHDYRTARIEIDPGQHTQITEINSYWYDIYTLT